VEVQWESQRVDEVELKGGKYRTMTNCSHSLLGRTEQKVGALCLQACLKDKSKHTAVKEREWERRQI